ncbi:MAG: riboflavin synthase [Planctomycetes bacterium]|nr:riboflavin synthase [Planctomycetota bacterium]
MFTGLVQHVVPVKSIEAAPHGKTLTLECGAWPPNPTVGESICVDGCCLTVVRIDRGALAFDVVPQTLQLTTIGHLRAGDPVNVERALRADSLMGGHVVQGHVDASAKVVEVDRSNGQWRTRIESPQSIDHLLHERGSIAVDGVSLTIAVKGEGWFEVALIPETLAKTTLARKLRGARVNLEADPMARMVADEVKRQMQQLGVPSAATKP